MYQHPYIAGQLARQRQREILAQAEQHRRARQVLALARAARRARWAERRIRQAIRKAEQLRAGLQQ